MYVYINCRSSIAALLKKLKDVNNILSEALMCSVFVAVGAGKIMYLLIYRLICFLNLMEEGKDGRLKNFVEQVGRYIEILIYREVMKMRLVEITHI